LSELADPTGLADLRAAKGMRLHPIGMFISFITTLPQLFFPIVAGLFGTHKAGFSLYTPFIILAVIGISLAFRWISWLRFRYTIKAQDIRIESGVLDRNVRSIPYDRIQDVSIEQRLLPRIFGLAEVRFETGGGKGDEAKLSFVSTKEADALRDLVRERKTGAAFETVSSAEPAPEAAPLYAMDMRRLLTLGFYSFSLIIFAVLYGVTQQLDFLLPFDFWDLSGWIGIVEERGVAINGVSLGTQIIGAVIVLAGLVFMGIASGIVRTVLRDYGFRLDRTDKGFRRQRGLLTRTDVVMPVHRVQAITLQTGPIRKRSAWYGLKFVSLAGDSDAKKGENDHVIAPLATLAEIWTIAGEAGVEPPAPDLIFTRGHIASWIDSIIIAFVFAVTGISLFAIFSPAGVHAFGILPVFVLLVLVTWFGWRNSLSAVDDDQLFVRKGWWRESMTIASQINVQSIEISQGPLARWRNIANVQFGIAGGDLAITAIPVHTARAIRDSVMTRVVAVDYSELAEI
jgi:putative membrane protein